MSETRLETVDHRLAGRRVVDPEGRTGILGTVVIERDRESSRVVSRIAHLRPVDGSGREWTTDNPAALRPTGPVTPDTSPQSAP
ncbi:hypothetical protein [Streptomyces sp. NBC_00212]|uniref:hypothetical protein n=1 Tax=Streptomyces sp. NBC_00212 TaxID=2975684 RepID=UPI002F9194DC